MSNLDICSAAWACLLSARPLSNRIRRQAQPGVEGIHSPHAASHHIPRKPDCAAGNPGNRRTGPPARAAQGYCRGHRPGCGQGGRPGAQDPLRTVYRALGRCDGDARGHARVAVVGSHGSAQGAGKLPLPSAGSGGPADHRYSRPQGCPRERCGSGVAGPGRGASAARG